MSSMTRRAAASTVFALGLFLGAEFVAPASAEAALQARGRVVEETPIDRQTREISSELRCVVCQGLSLQDSPSQLAQDMRAVVRQKLEEGMTPEEVKAFFLDSYGEWVLLMPKPQGFNLMVYVMPVLMLFGGGAFVFFRVRHWTSQKPREPEAREAEVAEV